MKRIVICGFGEMGKRHALDMEEHSDGKIKVVGVYEPDEKKYAEGCQWLKHQPERFDSIPVMLNVTLPDGAIISSPNFKHLENLRHFEGKNIPLILEKPLDSSLDKISEIVRFVENYAAPVMVHHVMRYAPIVKKAKEIIDSGKIGDICSFRFSQTMTGNMFHNFRRNLKTGGGQLLEKATHDFDVLLHWLESPPISVSAICRQQYFGGNRSNELRCSICIDETSCNYSVFKRKKSTLADVNPSNELCVYARCVDVPDNETCTLELKNGIFGTYSHTFFVGGYYSRVYEITGKKGVLLLKFSLPSHQKEKCSYDGTLEIFSNEFPCECYNFDYEKRIHYNGSPNVVKHFYDLMQGAVSEPYSPVVQAFAAEMIAIAAYKSNQDKKIVNVSSLLAEDLKEIMDKAFN